MNILLLIADQLSALALAPYGNGFTRTPNMDRLLQRGTRIRNCYSPCPLCAPARAAFWTGLHPHETGLLSNGRAFPCPDVDPHLPTIGSIFLNADYKTVHFGKRHDNGALRGFDCAQVEELPVDAECGAWPVDYDTRRDRYTVERACGFLTEPRDPENSPYLYAVDLNNPHNICNWIGHNRGEHEDRPVPGPLPDLPDNFDDRDLESRPPSVQYICCAHNRSAQTEGWTDTNFRHYLAAYHHYVERLDKEIGRLLDAVESRGDFADTLIILTADHSDAMTAHRQVTKHTSFYEETTRVPFIATGPGIETTGTLIDTPLASLLDLMPTLCELTQLPIPDGLRGRSLAPWLTGREQTGTPKTTWLPSCIPNGVLPWSPDACSAPKTVNISTTSKAIVRNSTTFAEIREKPKTLSMMPAPPLN
ncbi:sulfatase family protein [Puniceicoccus vermicola]|uniref:Sulfatase-like hydrolase/transferase n=1 Tax=Puniceicoccus vermicola TaxID=388746 RepID=A0A7X1B0K2_9BACT|nr:sulfatase-like hydrolase/transferase [Puniceicoccus vermicola]MBC2603249.1 sulfatase-like hydrolase/transferase [Puniceicoccus vermicola]